MAKWLRAAALLTIPIALAGCRRTTTLGSLTCQASADCAPPSTICGPDGRCVPGCVADPLLCVGAATCDPQSGECSGGVACTSDGDCEPPASVCASAAHVCVAGCTLSPCAGGEVCNPATGRCCDPNDPTCPRPRDGGAECNSDSECPGAPANICSAGACVPGCAATGCTQPLTCDAPTGHCSTEMCARDLDCDPGSYCTQASRCAVLAYGGAIACAGGAVVYYHCAQESAPAAFASCVGAPGPGGCPYCIDGSCFHPGLCTDDNGCHRGDTCVSGLCVVSAPPCPSLVTIDQITDGVFAAGKEVCVRGKVTSLRSGSDGMNEIRLGDSPFLFVDVSPLYLQAGVALPKLDQTVTVHGTVRWDAGHNDRELLPVDFIGP
ncbi:MAG TPA: hypothetical protein VII38_04740 [Polyangia bacterium]|jgi:hypothetical protein